MVCPRSKVALAGLLMPAFLLTLTGCSQGCGSGSGDSAQDAAQVFVEDAISASTPNDICRMVYEDDVDAALDWAGSFQRETNNADAASLRIEEKPDSPLGAISKMLVRDSDGKTVATITVEQSGRRYYVVARGSYVGEEE